MIFKKILLSLVLVFLSLLIGLLSLEGGLRFFQFLGENSIFGIKPYKTTLKWIENPKIGKVFFAPNQKGWFVTPYKEYFNIIKTNSAGFNDSEHAINKPKRTYRILFLGDSFVASVQTPMEKTFFKQIEKRLNKNSKGLKYEVIALGMGDTGTAQQYLTLQEIGIKYKPDLVIHMFLTANDIKNNSFNLMQDPYRPYFNLDKKGEIKLQPHLQYSKRGNSKIKDTVKEIYLVELLLSIRQNVQEREKNSSLDYPVDYHVYDKQYSKDYKGSWEVTKKLIVATKNLTEKNNSIYTLVTLANNEQVNKNVWEELKKTYPKMQNENLDLKKPDKLISEFCNKNQVNCLHLLPDFEKFVDNNPNARTHYKIDGHWNQIGTNIAAETLYNYIKEIRTTSR